MAELTITEWKPLRRNSMRGFMTATLPSGMVLHDVVVHVTDGKPWAAPPSKPMIGRDGVAMKDGNGKARYNPIISFIDKPTRERWSAAIIAALLTVHPDALAGSAE
ncbi:hypothetical protein [Acidiphilium rubrum]|uniref:hypothetical protein n=1 Tax=Acidiphilium rubrum TaxID=526 RepID=UPI002B911ACA|nr:hypothetical protein [Acidiphilium rubrum]HQT86529.1 hypothetical protein [Acidiphilium rubrum]